MNSVTLNRTSVCSLLCVFGLLGEEVTVPHVCFFPSTCLLPDLHAVQYINQAETT